MSLFRPIVRPLVRPLVRSMVRVRDAFILDQVEGAAFAIAPYTQLSKEQTQSIEVRETGGNTEETFGPQSQAAIEAFVVPADIKALFNERMYFDGVNDSVSIGSFSLSENEAFRFKAKVSFNPASSNFDRIYAVGAFGNCEAYYNGGNLTIYIGGSFRTISYSFSGDLQVLDINYDGTNLTVSVDGIQIYTSAFTHLGFSLATMALGVGSGHQFNGVMFDVEVYKGGVLDRAYQGYGNTNADWEDQIGSNNGTVNGSPALFTGQGFDGRIAKAYNQGSEAADAVQATAANQSTIATAGVAEKAMRFDGVNDTFSVAAGTLPAVSDWFMAVDVRSFTENGRLIQFGTGVTSSLTMSSTAGGNVTLELFINTGTTNGRYQWIIPLDSFGVLHLHFDTTTYTNTKLYRNGVELTRTISIEPVGTFTVPSGNLINIAGPTAFSAMTLGTFLYYPHALTTAEAAKVNNALIKAWGITV